MFVLPRPADEAGMECRIRLARPSDIPGLVDLVEGHAKFEQAYLDPSGLGERLNQAMFAPGPRLYGWIAEEEGVMAGYATATVDFSTWSGRDFVHMDCLFVCEPFRERGIGKALLDEVAGFARNRQLREVQWQTPVWNFNALRFYLKAGATHADKFRLTLPVAEAGRHRSGHGEDAGAKPTCDTVGR